MVNESYEVITLKTKVSSSWSRSRRDKHHQQVTGVTCSLSTGLRILLTGIKHRLIFPLYSYTKQKINDDDDEGIYVF